MAKGNGHAPTDPLLAALIEKLPPAGTVWPAADRDAWLKMMAMAFDVVYGRDGAIPVAWIEAAQQRWEALAPMQTTVSRPANPYAGHDFYVDKDGFARRENGARVSAADIPEDELIYDARGAARNRETVIWADDTTGALPGMNFCGPGPG